jgi:hypothetical protein
MESNLKQILKKWFNLTSDKHLSTSLLMPFKPHSVTAKVTKYNSYKAYMDQITDLDKFQE